MDISYSINAPAVTPAVTPAIAPAINPDIAPDVIPLLSLGLILVVVSRGRIRVTFFICDCQARVSSSSEGCSTSQKTVKVEAY